MKTSIFVRILIATLLPVTIVIIVVIGTARNVIYQDGIAYARGIALIVALQISEQATHKLENVTILLENISSQMAKTDFTKPEAKEELLNQLYLPVIANLDLYSAWFAFEPEVFSDERRYYKTIIRDDGEIKEIFDMSETMLENPAISYWYNIPLTTGMVFTNVDDYYDFGIDEGAIYTFTISHPIITDDGKIIGCVGFDINYIDLFPILGFVDGEVGKTMLVSDEGIILFSSDNGDLGKTLWDYGIQEVNEVSRVLREKASWQGEVNTWYGDSKLLVCLNPITIARTDQTVFLYRDTSVSSLYNSFYSSMQVIVLTGVIGMVLLGFCVFFTTRGIVGNVKRITDSFNRVANNSAENTLGGEHIPIYETNVIELDILQSALIKMMIELRKAHELKLHALEAEVEKEKLIASAQAKTNFFAIMSHEIRTPMNAILGISEIMLYEGNLSPTQEKYIQDIKISSDALLNIINDILDISRLETGKVELRLEHYNFRALIDNVTSLINHLAVDANLRFLFKPKDELPICLYGDGTRLRQVLLNLLGNAIKFTKEGYVQLIFYMSMGDMCFEIVDSGVGIRQSEIEYIFESFNRIDTKRNREVKGTGLGLPISKSLVELMGGTISVESEYGKGSIFKMTIPLVLGDERKLRKKKFGKGTQYDESVRVLVVDDDRTNLNVSSGLLKAAHGIRCDTAISGSKAIAMVQAIDYDIIFMDHMMPELDGVDTTQLIRKLGGRYRTVPIIALTANTMIGTKKELMDGGMNDFLAKPIQSERLQDILETWLPEGKRIELSKGAEQGDVEVEQEEADEIEPAMSNAVLGIILEEAGINTTLGLEHIGLDEEMYIQSIKLLKQRIPTTIKLLNELLKLGNMREFGVYVHGLKGALANVGAVSLSKDAMALETKALENKINDCRELLESFAKKMEVMYNILAQTLPDVLKSQSETPFDMNELKDGLQRLYAALESYDYEAVSAEMNAVLSMEYSPDDIMRIKVPIDNFNYHGAIEILDEILKKFDSSPES